MDRTNREQFDCVSFVQFIFVGHQKASKTNRKKILLLGGWNPFVSRHTARYCATCTTAPHPASESQILGNVWGYVSYPLAIYLYRLYQLHQHGIRRCLLQLCVFYRGRVRQSITWRQCQSIIQHFYRLRREGA